jgi:hypothetical protein
MHSVKDRSPFALAALALDSDFQELERLAGQLERHEYATDQDFEHARKLLAAFGECGQRIGGGVQSLASELEQARARAEKAAQVVGERSVLIQQRQDEAAGLLDAFQALAGKARELTESMQGLKGLGREALLEKIPGLSVELEGISSEVAKLEKDAASKGLKGLARDAGSMKQSLNAALERLKVG